MTAKLMRAAIELIMTAELMRAALELIMITFFFFVERIKKITKKKNHF